MSEKLTVEIGTSLSGLTSGLASASKKISNFSKRASKDLAKLREQGENLKDIGRNMTTYLTLPITAVGAASLKAYADIESLQFGLKAVMGSAKAASDEFVRLKEVAKLPGLGLKEAVEGSVSLQAAGFSAAQARDTLLSFGNALATVGKGAREMDMVILALTQMQNKTTGYGQEIRQLTEQLPQLRGALRDAFGTAESEKIAQSGLTGEEVVQKLTKEFQKLPKVTGGLKNAFENLRDSITINLFKIGGAIDKAFDISSIIDKVTGFISKIVNAFTSLNPAIQKVILTVVGLVAAAGPLLLALGGIITTIPVISAGLAAVGAAFTFLLSPIGLVIAALVGVVVAVTKNWGKIKPYIIKAINWFIDLYNESMVFRIAVEGLVLRFKTVFSIISNILKTAWEVIKSFAKGVADAFSGIATVFKGSLTGDFGEIKRGLGKILGAYVTFGKNLRNDLTLGFKSMWSDITNNVKQAIDNGLNPQKKERIKDITFFDKDVVKNKTKKTIVEGVSKGVQASGKVIKDIKLPQIYYPKLLSTDDIARNFVESQADHFKFGKMINDTISSGVSVIRGFTPTFLQAFLDFEEGVNDLISASSISDALGGLFNNIGQSMANGMSFFGALGSGVLKMLGNFLSEFGGLLIKFGVAAAGFAKLQMALMSGNPFTTIGAAIGLIAIGGLLKVLGSAISSAAGSGGGSYSGGSSGGNSFTSSSSFSSGGRNGSVVFRISGRDLVGVLENNNQRLERLDA